MLNAPLILGKEERDQRWYGKIHAYIVDQIAADVRAGRRSHDGVIFPDTVDGMEVGDVVVVLPRISGTGEPCLDHAVTTLGWRRYDEMQDDWVSSPGFDDRRPVLEPGVGLDATRELVHSFQHNRG